MNEPAGRHVGLNDGVHSAAPCQLLSGGRAPTELDAEGIGDGREPRVHHVLGFTRSGIPPTTGPGGAFKWDRCIGDRSVTPLALSLVDDRTHLLADAVDGTSSGVVIGLCGHWMLAEAAELVLALVTVALPPQWQSVPLIAGWPPVEHSPLPGLLAAGFPNEGER